MLTITSHELHLIFFKQIQSHIFPLSHVVIETFPFYSIKNTAGLLTFDLVFSFSPSFYQLIIYPQFLSSISRNPTVSMAEHVHADHAIHGCFSKVDVGRLKGFVSTTAIFVFFFFLLAIAALLNWMNFNSNYNLHPSIVFLDMCIRRGTPPPPPPPLSSEIRHERVEFPLNCSNLVNHTTVVEVNIKPWEEQLRAIKKERERIKWEKREPYAYWKGNPTSPDRVDLLNCNVSDKHDWNARLYVQDWAKEIQEGFKHSKLEDQCTHRYKIYIEGATWSVSEKYILACDSMTLLIKPKYYDFFSRSMVSMQHYWPIRRKNKCRDLKFAVEWGNNHPHEAQAIGKAGSKFIEETLTMRNVYDYMFHLLSEYSKLLKFKPTIPSKAHRVCAESVACLQKGLWKDFMVQSMVKSPSRKLPCALHPPFEPQAIQASLDREGKITRQVETWVTEYWRKTKPKNQ
ncbi:hypothetical protein J1N35_020678 [Gossypium stocksii]|uniref:Glycosyl transferase CAP10 domain-containing protein n=1 Tax=Gossypium stocksii TaxID=47602 RepID=A0A9D4A140_9ROSI|nr:hypothetical protein J1N35_020678 [Gossypium stocksii]